MLPPEVRNARKLAFKTGTSYGFRDAWAVGYDAEVTIAVWAGRADGTPLPGSTGRTTAAPVLVRIADLLGPPAAQPGPHPAPEGALGVWGGNRPGRPARRAGGPRAPARREAGGPKILCPPNGATVEWHGESVPLEAAGGTGSLRWLADGRPLPAG